MFILFFFSSRRRHTRSLCDWSSDVCSSDLDQHHLRALVGNAGVIEAEVVLIARRSPEDELRWVYLDIGKFHGLAETIGESIRYPIRTSKDRDSMAPCVVAGPTCDSVDVLYEKTPYPLPVSLAIGDKVLIEAAGAYTTTYSSVGFNGYPPLRQYVI